MIRNDLEMFKFVYGRPTDLCTARPNKVAHAAYSMMQPPILSEWALLGRSSAVPRVVCVHCTGDHDPDRHMADTGQGNGARAMFQGQNVCCTELY